MKALLVLLVAVLSIATHAKLSGNLITPRSSAEIPHSWAYPQYTSESNDDTDSLLRGYSRPRFVDVEADITPSRSSLPPLPSMPSLNNFRFSTRRQRGGPVSPAILGQGVPNPMPSNDPPNSVGLAAAQAINAADGALQGKNYADYNVNTFPVEYPNPTTNPPVVFYSDGTPKPINMMHFDWVPKHA